MPHQASALGMDALGNADPDDAGTVPDADI
jgi:hypothetical protein